MADGRVRIERERTIRAIIFRRVKSRTLGFVMLPRRNAGGPLGANAGSDLVAVPAMHGGGERGDYDLAPLGGGVQRVLLEHERLLRGSTATRHRAPNPFADKIPSGDVESSVRWRTGSDGPIQRDSRELSPRRTGNKCCRNLVNAIPPKGQKGTNAPTPTRRTS